MNESSTTATDTAACPSWCTVDHEDGALACQTERRAVVRVPKADPRDVSTVHAFGWREGGCRLTIDGKFFTIAAAREYAAKILETCDEVTPADPAAVIALRTAIEERGWRPGPVVHEGMTVAQASRGIAMFGSLLEELQTR